MTAVEKRPAFESPALLTVYGSLHPRPGLQVVNFREV